MDTRSPFAPPVAAVPIIGQPVELRAWFFQLLLVCKCSNTPLLMIGSPGQANITCPECKKTYRLDGPQHVDLQISVQAPRLDS